MCTDYVTKWVEVIPTNNADAKTSLKMLKDVIFPRFGVPRYLMTNGGSHFIHGVFRNQKSELRMLNSGNKVTMKKDISSFCQKLYL